MTSFVVGMAGHVDHGKTALVRALTGVETDRLPEEKRRGITIELGFAPWRLADDMHATIVDMPGHRRLVHTMIAGAAGIALVLLVVAANDGVMPQTCEHANVCEALGVRDAVVVLTKADRVDPETLALAEAESRELLQGRFALDVVACSALQGTGLDRVRSVVTERLRRLERHSSGPRVRMWVDRVLTIRGAGTVATGTLISGSASVGDVLALHTAGDVPARRTSVRGLRIHDERVPAASAPTRLALALDLSTGELHRGDLLSTETGLAPTRTLDVVHSGSALRKNQTLTLHIGTTRVGVRATRSEDVGEDAAVARLVMSDARTLAGGDRVLLRAVGAGRTPRVLGATVLDARPSAGQRSVARRERLRALVAGDAEATLRSLVREVAPRSFDLEGLEGRFSLPATDLHCVAERLVSAGALVQVGAGVASRATLDMLANLARGWVREHLEGSPFDRALPLATLRQRLTERAGADMADRALLVARARAHAEDDEAIRVEGDVVLPSQAVALPPLLARARAAALASLEAAGARGRSLAQVRESTGLDEEAARKVLRVIERERLAVASGGMWFSREAVAALRARLVAHLGAAGAITTVEFKELAGVPRNQAVILLEYFDRLNVTRRTQESRTLAGPASP